MEPLGVFADAEWESFSKIFSTEDHEIDLTSQFFGQFTFPHEHEEELHFLTPSTFYPNPEANVMNMVGVHESLFYSSDDLNSNLHNVSQDSSYGSDCSGSAFLPSPTHQTAYFYSNSNHIPITNGGSMSTDICVMDDNKIDLQAFPDFLIKETSPINEYMNGNILGNSNNGQAAAGVFQANELQLKRKFDHIPAMHTGAEIFNANSSENTKKKPRLSRDVQKTKKNNVQSKKNRNQSPKNANEGEERNGTGTDGQSSSSYSSEDDNASQETMNEGAIDASVNLNGKPRASRGSATDPQSLYARKRRERINERLKVLQNLVPNGTKVDISTMLEEAVHYVKFMQLQIKLLSSDDLWMYAPIAYNGVDVSVNQKISLFL
ncbi:hypothetical protein ACOSQ3_010771 [Xanthoceras sorbifolium]